MSTLPPCPKCNSTLTYEDGSLLICPECAHEWSANAAAGRGAGRARDRSGAEEQEPAEAGSPAQPNRKSDRPAQPGQADRREAGGMAEEGNQLEQRSASKAGTRPKQERAPREPTDLAALAALAGRLAVPAIA